MQYRTFTIEVTLSDVSIAITANIQGNIITESVDRDGSEDTNYAAAMVAIKANATALPATATSPPCTVTPKNRWIKQAASASLATTAQTILVPPSNAGVLVLHLEPTTATAQYKKNSGSFTTFTDGTEITVANNDTLTFQATSIPAQESVNGTVVDKATATLMDLFSLMNTTP